MTFFTELCISATSTNSSHNPDKSDDGQSEIDESSGSESHGSTMILIIGK